MLFNFDTTEDDTTDITIDDDIVDNSTDIQDTLEVCDMFCMQYNNLVLIQNHVKKFGFNKQMLHLLNSNNNLFKMLNLDMPELPVEQVDEVIVKLNMEADFSFYETVKKAKDEFIRIFNLIINKIKEVYRAFMVDVEGLNKKIIRLRKDKYGSHGQYIDEPATLKKEVKACSIQDWDIAISSLYHASLMLNKVGYISFNNNVGFVNITEKPIKAALAILNYEITLNTNTGFLNISRKEAPNEFETKDLHALGWVVANTYKKLDISLNYIGKMRDLNKFISQLEKEKKTLIDDEKVKVSKAIILNQVKTLVHICNILMDGFKKYLTVLIKIADKAVMKKG